MAKPTETPKVCRAVALARAQLQRPQSIGSTDARYARKCRKQKTKTNEKSLLRIHEKTNSQICQICQIFSSKLPGELRGHGLLDSGCSNHLDAGELCSHKAKSGSLVENSCQTQASLRESSQFHLFSVWADNLEGRKRQPLHVWIWDRNPAKKSTCSWAIIQFVCLYLHEKKDWHKITMKNHTSSVERRRII